VDDECYSKKDAESTDFTPCSSTAPPPPSPPPSPSPTTKSPTTKSPTTKSPTTKSPTTTQSPIVPPDYRFVNCYKHKRYDVQLRDSQGKEAVKEPAAPKIAGDPGATVDNCARACATSKYFMTKGKNGERHDCYCGHSINDATEYEIAIDKCRPTYCASHGVNCRAKGYNAIFEVLLPPPLPPASTPAPTVSTRPPTASTPAPTAATPAPTAATPVPTAFPTAGRYSYVGCFKERKASRQLRVGDAPERYATVAAGDAGQSLGRCASACVNFRFFSYIRHPSESSIRKPARCLCGDRYADTTRLVTADDSDDSDDSGDSDKYPEAPDKCDADQCYSESDRSARAKCGGRGYNAIYKFDVPTPPPSAGTPSPTQTWRDKWVGCFKEKKNNRQLRTSTGDPAVGLPPETAGQSVASCAAACAGSNYFSYIARHEKLPRSIPALCICGHSYLNNTSTDDDDDDNDDRHYGKKPSKCDSKYCRNDDDFNSNDDVKCGAKGYNAIYSLP